MIRCGSGRAPAAAPQRPPASVAMRAGFVAALLHGAQVAGQPTCLNDCSLNGVCQHGACVCDPPWHGTDCAVLDILPSDARGGAIYGVSPRVGSWGGNVLHVGGKFHLYVAEFAGEDCGMVSWRSNSQIRHAMSDTIDGTYVKADLAVESWSHNPEVIEFGAELFLFHIGSGNGSAHVNCSGGPPDAIDSSGGNASRRWQEGQGTIEGSRRRPELGAQLTYIHVAAGPDGPWSPVGSVECDNPAPLVLRNGTVLLMCDRFADPERGEHWRLYRAESPRGPWEQVEDIYPRTSRTSPASEE